MARRGFQLRAIYPTEAQVQAGVLRLAAHHPAVSMLVRTNAGSFCILRPPPGQGGWAALRSQISAAVKAGIFSEAQVGWVRGVPRDYPDSLGQMRSGHAVGLEYKAPGKKAKPGQIEKVERISRHGGLGAVVESIDQADALFNAWDKSHRIERVA